MQTLFVVLLGGMLLLTGCASDEEAAAPSIDSRTQASLAPPVRVVVPEDRLIEAPPIEWADELPLDESSSSAVPSSSVADILAHVEAPEVNDEILVGEPVELDPHLPLTDVPEEPSSSQSVAQEHMELATGHEEMQQRFQAYTRVRDEDNRGGAGEDGLSIDLVMDETQTRLGGDFYDAFYSQWEAPASALNFTITIEEHPTQSRGRGTRIVVRVDEEVSFQAQLQPRQEFINQAAEYAAYRTRQLLQQGEASPSMY